MIKLTRLYLEPVNVKIAFINLSGIEDALVQLQDNKRMIEYYLSELDKVTHKLKLLYRIVKQHNSKR